MGDALEDELGGADGSGIQSSGNVYMSDELAPTPAWAAGDSSAPPVNIVGTTQGTPQGGGFWSDLGKSLLSSSVQPLAGAFNRLLGGAPPPGSAVPHPASSGPSTGLLVAGAVGVGVVGWLFLRNRG